MKSKSRVYCKWFANCKNPADGTLYHPVLGDVPICPRCRAWYERMSKPPISAQAA